MRPGLLLFLVLFAGSAASAQISCPPLPAPAIPAGANIFNGAQEMELGEIVRQQAEQEFSAIDEDVLTGYVKSVGARVASHLPDTGLRYEFVLYDRPEIQAFGMPGGRVYVSRKMVAFLRNEDELAGLLGHELGHMASRQQAIYLSQMFRDVLGIKSIGNEDDLYERYNELVDRMRLKNLRAGSDPEKGQEIADQLGVQAVARAGYARKPFPIFWIDLWKPRVRPETGSPTYLA